MIKNDLEKYINKSLKHLSKLSIEKLASATAFEDEKCTKEIRKVEVIFPAVFLLHSLCLIENSYKDKAEYKIVLSLKKRLIKFLNKQSSGYSFNYWTLNSELKKQYPLPNDLDDTAVTLAALIEAGEEIDEKYILNILNLETQPSGPYTTWYLSKEHKDYKKWNDVDPAVNANLLYLGSVLELKFEGSENFVAKKIASGNYKSAYYPYKLTVLYYFARYIYNCKNDNLKKQVKSELKNFKWKNLTFAEKVFYLLCLGYIEETITENYLSDIMESQQSSGIWPIFPICIDFAYTKKSNTYIGGEVINIALLTELSFLINGQKNNNPRIDEEKKINPLVKRIVDEVILDLNNSEILTYFEEFFDIKELYSAKAVILSTQLALELKPKLDKQDKLNLINFCKGILHGWLFYTIEDKLIDKELDVKFVAILATLSRFQWEYFSKIKVNDKNFIKNLAIAADITNKNYIFEAEVLHYGDKNPKDLMDLDLKYDYILNRMHAFITAMSYISVVLNLSNRPNKAIYNVVKNIVLLDQLNDDSHDWQEDLDNKIMTFVTFNVLKESRDSKPSKQLFWEKIMPLIIRECEKIYSETQTILKSNPSVFLSILLEKSFIPINQAKVEIEKSMKIIEYFS